MLSELIFMEVFIFAVDASTANRVSQESSATSECEVLSAFSLERERSGFIACDFRCFDLCKNENLSSINTQGDARCSRRRLEQEGVVVVAVVMRMLVVVRTKP